MIIVYTDGGSRGNPGPAAYGVRIESPDGVLIDELQESIGIATNNVAEYRGLLAGLDYAIANGQRDVLVRSDSELLVKQMKGEYKVKHPDMQRLHAEARMRIAKLGKVKFEHVRRAMNAHADGLANKAMDAAMKRAGE